MNTNKTMRMSVLHFSMLFTLLFSFFTVISCADDIDEIKTNAGSNTYLVITPNGVSVDARSIEPTEEYAQANLKSVYLYATKTKDASGNAVSVSKKTLLNSVESLAAVYNKMLLLEDGAGTYTFEMRASLDTVCFYQKQENITIEEAKSNTISFALSPVVSKSDYSDFGDYGGISVKMNFSSTNVSSIYVTLLNLDTDEITEQKYITSGISYGSYTYKKVASYSTSNSDGKIPTGTYRLTFDFLSYDSTAKKDVVMNSFPYIVHVVKGRNSVIEQTFDLNQIYTITYNNNSGSLAEGEIKPTKFSRCDEVVLPIMQRSGYSFMGWFEKSDFSGEPLTKIPKGTTENKTLYAKFELSRLYVDATNGKDTNDGSSSGASYALKTLSAAFSKIEETNNPNYDWTIYATGTFNENVKVQGLPAKSILIQGQSTSGTDTIAGDGVSGYPLESYGNVLLKNITIAANGNLGANIRSGTLTLENGAKIECTAQETTGSYGVMISGATVIMNGDSQITGFKQTSGYAVYLEDENSKLVMNGDSSITNCKTSTSDGAGGAVYLQSGLLEMNGNAKISGCESLYGGGVYVATKQFVETKGRVVMNGNASIENCTAKLGGGIYISNGSVTMNDSSTITGCKGSVITGTNDTNGAGGVDVGENGTFTMNDTAAIKNCTGHKNGAGGVYVRGAFNMNGGSITGNTSGSSSDTMSNGAGGVNVDYTGRFVMKSGSISSNNGAGSGGVFVSARAGSGSGVFEMQAGTVSSNTTTSTSRLDIGVYLGVSTSLAGQGTACGLFKISGDAVVSDDNMVNMPSPSVLTVSGKLASEKAATLAFYTYSTGSYSFVYTEDREVLALADGVTETTLEAECGKIAVKPQSVDDGTVYWRINSEGKLQTVSSVYYVGAEGNDSNNGISQSTALSSIPAALEKIAANGNIAAEYTIKISGTLTGAQKIDSTLTTDMAKSLTLEGVTGKSGETWADVLDGGFTSASNGTTLTLSTTVPVIMKNLKITGGYVSGSGGGGVKISAGASLTMESGEISGNTGIDGGQSAAGGVYLSHGSASWNGSYSTVIVPGALFTMNGGSICNNTGNGVTMYDGSAPGDFIMNGGTITGNTGYGVDMVYSTGPFGKFMMKGDAVVTSDNKVFLGFPGSTIIYIAGELTGNTPVATVKLNGYNEDRQVLSLADGVTDTSLEAAAKKFAVASDSSTNWYISNEGKLTTTAPN
ncbi:MAG: InlB B-repeat-containing protein [Treponema sp.]|nr:InlB B-repeat-containing protein [Treponema sp.]